MTYRIKNLHDASIRMFHSKNFEYPKYDRDNARNKAILTRLFNDTLSGRIKGFYLIDETDFRAWHRSPKQEGYIQFSVGFYRNGELLPCMDLQFKTVEEFLNEGCPSGRYAEII